MKTTGILLLVLLGMLVLPAGAWYGASENLGPSSDYTYAVATGDLDKDGNVDIVTGDFSGQNVIYFGDGDGTFDTRQSPLGPGNDLTEVILVFDANNDTWLDIAVGNWQQQNVLYMNDGDGTFDTVSYNFGTGTDQTFALAYGDTNGDTLPDLAVGNIGQQNYVYLHDGVGNPYDTLPVPFGMPPNYDDTWDLVFADMNRDTILDLVVANHQQPNFVYLGDGDGTFDTTSFQFGIGTQFHHALAVGDLNGDTILDVVEGNYNGQNRAYLGDGTGNVTESYNFGLTGDDKTQGAALADFNGDGRLDILFVNGGDEPQLNHIYYGNGDGTFGAMRTLAHEDTSWDTKVADFNNDGRADIVVANVGQDYVYLDQDTGVEDIATLFNSNTFFVAGDTAYCTDVLGSAKIAFGLAQGGASQNPEGRTDLFLTQTEHDTGNLIPVGGPAVNPLATELDGYCGITYTYLPTVSFSIHCEGQTIFLDLTQYPAEDICIVYVGKQNNRNVMIVWGYGWEGTYAGSVFIGDPANWTTYLGYHLFMLRWYDLNADGLVQSSEIVVEKAT